MTFSWMLDVHIPVFMYDILLEMFDDKHVHVFDNLLHVYHTKSIFTKKLVINIKLDIIE